jgi:hypothetical protein
VWATCDDVVARLSALQELIDHRMGRGGVNWSTCPIVVYSHLTSSQVILSVELTRTDLMTLSSRWWKSTSSIKDHLSLYEKPRQTSLINLLLVHGAYYQGSVWAEEAVLKYGVLLEVQGEAHALESTEGWLFNRSLVHGNSKENMIVFQRGISVNDSSLWILMKSTARTIFKALVHFIKTQTNGSFEVFRPLGAGDKIWTTSAGSLRFAPLVRQVVIRRLHQGQADEWLIIVEGVDRCIQQKSIPIPSLDNAVEHMDRFADEFDLHLSTHSPSYSAPLSLTLKMIPKKRLKSTSSGLLFKCESQAQNIATNLLDSIGLALTKMIEVFRFNHDEIEAVYQVAWVFHQSNMFEAIQAQLTRLNIPDDRYLAMSPYHSHPYPDTHYSQMRVWLPTPFILTPLPSPKGLLQWMTEKGEKNRSMMAWLTVNQEGEFITYMIDPRESVSMYELIDISLSYRHQSSIIGLSFLDELTVSIDLSQPRTESDSLSLDAEKSALSTSKIPVEQSPSTLEGSKGQSEEAIIEPPIIDPPPNNFSDSSTRTLREQLRKVSLPDSNPITLKERAQRWFDQLEHHIPNLLNGRLSPNEWLVFANHLWWNENHERSLDALTWALLENTLHEGEDVKLTGWLDRLSRPIRDEKQSVQYVRLTLYSLANSEIEMVNTEHDQYMIAHTIQMNEQLHLNRAWLMCHYLFSDDLIKYRVKEWAARCLALGLTAQHCDQFIQKSLTKQGHKLEKERERLEANQPGESVDQLAMTSSSFNRLKIWGNLLIDTWRKAFVEKKLNTEPELLILDQMIISMLGVRSLLSGEVTVSLPKSLILSNQQSQRLLTRYQQHSDGDRARDLSRLRVDTHLEFWKKHSTLNQRHTDATPLGASLKAVFSSSPNGDNVALDHDPHLMISQALLKLTLKQVISSLRPRVRSYLSFRDLLRRAIDDALARFDKTWLEMFFNILPTWIDDLSKISTAPYEVLTQLDLERLRVGYVVARDQLSSRAIEEWVDRWFLKPPKTLTWRMKMSFVHEFATQGIDGLLSYLSPIKLRSLISQVLMVFDQGGTEDIEAERFASQHLLRLELDCIRLLLLVRSEQLQDDAIQESEPSLVIDNEMLSLFDSLLTWIIEFEESTQSRWVGGVTRFKPPLSAWLYQLQYYSPQYLQRLIDLWLPKILSLSMIRQARVWYVLEDCFLSTPLHEDVHSPHLELWLRGRERVLRQVWSSVL